MLDVKDISWVPGRPILQSVSFSSGTGEILGVIGPNGSGKSSLLRVLAGIEDGWQGDIQIDGKDLRSLPAEQRARKLSWLPQSTNPNNSLTVEQAVNLGRLANPYARVSVPEVLADLDLRKLRNRKLGEISGGELGRALLARCFVSDPGLVLLDEPLAAQDPYYQLLVLEYLEAMAGDGKSLLIVLHDLNLLASCCPRSLVLAGGKSVYHGDTGSMLASGLLEEVYRVSVKLVQEGEYSAVITSRRSKQGV